MFAQSNIRVSRRWFSYLPIASSILVLLALLVVPELLPSPSFADEPITVNPSITIGNSGVLSLDVNPGQFGSSTESVVVTTSNYTGYSMTIAPSSGNNTDLEHTNVANTVIPSISESLSSSDFSSLSTAAYGLSIDEGTNYIPVENGTTIKTTSGPTNATTGAFTLTLGAKTLSSTPAGTYTKSFMLTATANAAAYSITYNANTGSSAGDQAVTNMPSANESSISGTTVTISGKTPARSGYNFLGWAESSSATTATIQPSGTFTIDPETANAKTYYAVWQEDSVTIVYDANGGSGSMPEATYKYENKQDGDTLDLLYASNYSRSGYGFAGFSFDQNAYTHLTDNDATNDPVIYGPNQYSITIPSGTTSLADSNGKVKLYAVWVPAETDSNNNPVYLQGWSGCANMSDGDITALTDIRDNEVYAVAKIEKNVGQSNEYSQCWVIENMRIDIATANITKDNTNNPTDSFMEEAALLGSAYWNPCALYVCSGTDFYNHISYSLGNINGSGTASYTGDSQNTPWYSYGGMYNWNAITAGHGYYKSSGSFENTAGDICPSDWRLPAGGTAQNSEWSKLNVALGGSPNQESSGAGDLLLSFPQNFVLSGIYFENEASGRGETGAYYSATKGTYEENVIAMSLSHNTFYGSSAQTEMDAGESLRCIIDNTWGIHYVANAQDATGTMLDQAVNPGETITLKANEFHRSVSGTTGYMFTGWNTQANGLGTSYAEGASVTDLTTAGDVITLYAQWEQVSPLMTINYNSNGLSFADSSTTNTAYYYSDCDQITTSEHYSHTPNLLDNGERNMNYDGGDVNGETAGNYPEDYEMNEVITVPGASKLHITLTYSTESDSYDWVSIWSGSHPGYTAEYDYDAEEAVLLGDVYENKYGGYNYDNEDAFTVEGDIDNTNTVTIGFISDYSYVGEDGYGYYAVVVGLDSNDQPIASAYTVCSRSRGGGEYKTPVTTSTQQFLGWSENPNATTADYTNEKDVINNLPGDNGQTKTLYAVWHNLHVVHFNGNGADSGTMADQKIPAGSTAILNSYAFIKTGYEFLGWDENQNAATATYANQADFTAPAIAGETTLYAIWKLQLKIIYHSNYGNDETFNQYINAGATESLKNQFLFTRSGYKIGRWDTSPAGDGTSYAPLSSYTAPANVHPGDELHLYAVWVQTYTIRYDINGGDTGTMGTHTGVGEWDQVTLYASNFSRANYGFAGWNTRADGTGTQYGPNETITAPAYPEGGTLTLYAKWVASTGNIQGWTGCSSLASGAVTALTDTRDNQVYAVAKLADGNCWMIENLRLEAANSSDSTKAQGFGGDFTGLATAESSHFTNFDTTPNSIYPTPTITGENQAFRIPRYNNSNTANRGNNSTGIYNTYSYGNYYNWAAAKANTNDIITDSDSMNSTNIGTSICPKGWHLPYGGNETSYGGNTNGGIYYLNYKLNNDNFVTDATASNNFRRYPNNFLYSGVIENSSFYSRNSKGSYWTATNSSITNTAYFLGFSKTGANITGASDVKTMGLTVRCVAFRYHTLTISTGTGVDTVTIDGTTYHDGDTIDLEEGTSHTINMTFASGYEFDSWSISGTGSSVGSTSTQSTTLTMGTANATLTASAKGNTLQTWNDCDSMGEGKANAITLTDARDGQTYTVTKYNMGNNTSKCWMSNLNLGATSFASGVTQLDNTNTNLPNDSSKFISTSSFMAWDRTTSGNAYSYAEPKFTPLTGSDPDYGWNYGTLYNYAAASANTINAASGANNDNAQYSLCPSGWRLPTGGSSGEFQAFYNANSPTGTTMQSDFGFSLAGYFGSNIPAKQGAVGYYWSSTRIDGYNMYYLFFSSSNVYPANDVGRGDGSSIRCIKE